MNQNINVQGVSEKELKTILETSNGLCNGVKGNYRDMARKVFAQLFATKTVDPERNHVLQALKAAKKCELTLDGKTQTGKIKIKTHDAIKAGKMDVESVEWDDSNLMLKLEAVTL